MTHPQNAKVIVIGGSGETGKRIVSHLSQTYPDIKIASAARRHQPNLPRASNIEAVVLDIADEQSAVAVLSAYDLAILALGPMDTYGNAPHKLCLQANIDVIDINDNLEATDQILDLHDQAKEMGRSIFTGIGFAPGLSTLLLMQLARQQVSSEGHYHCRLYMGAAYGGGETSPYAMLASFRNQMECYQNGTRCTRHTPWKDRHSQFRFPAQRKAVALIPFASPEIAGLSAGRCPDDLSISTLDSRYHIQYLPQGFARFLARFKLNQGMTEYFAKKFYAGGQSKKHQKDADPDTTLWVYPDGHPEQGLMVHGVVSSYDLTALMACAATDCWLNGEMEKYTGVYAMEHLQAETHQQLTEALARRGITSRTSNEQGFKEADIHFGWVDSACHNFTSLRNFGKNWYSFERPHPKMAFLQKRFLVESEIWKSLKQKLNPLSFTLFVLQTLSRWNVHNKQLAHYRQREGKLAAARWQAITKDMSMFTSGYSCAREVLGAEMACELYRRMFLDTGKMEMRWLWPKPETFAGFANPEQAIMEYWAEFMRNYHALGVFDLAINESDKNQLQYTISNCVYGKMFMELGCPELSNLVREMEKEALEYITRESEIIVLWLPGEHGSAQISLNSIGFS